MTSGAERLGWWVVVLLLGVAGCGNGEERTAPMSTASVAATLGDCQRIGQNARGELALCQEKGPGAHGVFVVNDDGGRRELAIGPPNGGRVGHWDWAALSPDGSTLLAQWSAECEVPIAFFIPMGGGDPRVVSGERDWATSPTSIALGWTTDGRAIVLFPTTNPCGSAGDAGLYLVATDNTHTQIRDLDRFAEKLERSTGPRTVASLKKG